MNPFVVNGIIPEKYFCDRKVETARLVEAIENNTNILLTSPRRMGKTQLIRHTFAQPAIKERYYMFYSDIYATSSLQEFIIYLGREIASQLVPHGKKALELFFSTLKSLSGVLSYDPVKGVPIFNIHLGDIVRPELTLSEIFDYLQNADKPCVFAIDEFQKVGDYSHGNVEALLRTHIQTVSNCRFIFAGSNRHVLENMFNSPSRPFYKSVGQMYLDRIDRDLYVDFVVKTFADSGKNILVEDTEWVYDLFEGHTYYVHYLMNRVFSHGKSDDAITKELIKSCLTDIIEEQAHSFATTTSQLSYQQKEVLIAICKEKKARGVTSVTFMKKYALTSPSSVQNALRTLIDRDIVTYDVDERGTKCYSIVDRYYALWLDLTY